VKCDEAKWEEVVEILVRELPEQFLKDDEEDLEFDPLDIANVIMLQDNYLCALINEGLIDLTLPIIGIPVLTKVQ
jgi:hypothetical protein